MPRPPPGCTPEQNFWKSLPQLLRSTRASASGEALRIIGAGAVGAAGVAAGGAAAGAALADSPPGAAGAAGAAAGVVAGIAGASAPWQPAETWEACCTRHWSEACVPVGTLEHTFM